MKSAFFLFLIVSNSLVANTLENQPQVQSHFSCFTNQFESYDKWFTFLKDRNPNFKAERFPFKADEFNTFKESLDCSIFDYIVDDIVVQGFLIHPKDAQNMPTIIFNRGGNGGYGRVNMGRMMYDLMPLANKGFAVIGSQYRWNKRNDKVEDFIADGKSDEFGGIDQKDVSALLPIIESLSVSDSKRIGVYGVSRGGMQSYLFAKSHPNIKAMVIKAGIADVFDFRDRSEKTKVLLSTRIPEYHVHTDDKLKQRSAVYWPEALPEVPILLVHAKDDERVSYSDSERMTEALKKLNRPHNFLSFESGGHDLTGHKERVDLEVQNWFSNYLQ